MKRYTCNLIAFLFITIAFTACKKANEFPLHTAHGSIRQDFGMCADCGGYFIKFDNDTSTIYRSFQLPDNSGITSSTKFPIKGTIGWKPDTSVKIPNFITITSLRIDR